MIPRERIIKAMSLEIPDRVPVMCQFSIGFMNQQIKEAGITPMELWLDADRYAEALIRENVQILAEVVKESGVY
ncbi:MAG: hypothetical protein ABFR75_14810 [Acidobacteriota bacterium]